MIRSRLALLSRTEGSAAVEFTFLIIGMLLPLSWVVATLASVYSATLATEDAAKQSARAFSLSANPGEASAAAQWVVDQVVASHRLSNTSITATFACSTACLQPGGSVTAEVRAEVGLPWVPPQIGLPPAVVVDTIHIEPIDFYRNSP